MNNKLIIGIVCVLIVICLAVGIGMNSKSGNSENEANLISDKETVYDIVERSAQNEKSEMNSKKEENSPTVKSEKEQKVTAASSVKKAEEARPSVKNTLSTNRSVTTSAKTKPVPQAPVKTTKTQSINVSFSVNCEKAAAYDVGYPKYIIEKTKCKAENGTTVFDLLSEECSKNGIAFVHQNKSYIKAIGGLSEKDCGNASGWIYKVNGEKPMMAASKYVLKDGDVVEWYYVTSPTD